jgi:hypothetical protein
VLEHGVSASAHVQHKHGREADIAECKATEQLAAMESAAMERVVLTISLLRHQQRESARWRRGRETCVSASFVDFL